MREPVTINERTTNRCAGTGQRKTMRFSGRPHLGWLVYQETRPHARKQPATVAANMNQITDGRPTATMNTLPTTKMSPPMSPATSVEEKLICGDSLCGSVGIGMSDGCRSYHA